MLWGCAPASHGGGLAQETPAEPLVSRELLRSVCEPFFEQMLTALQQALQQTQKQQFSKEAQIMQPTLQMTKISSFQSASRPISHQLSHLDPMLDEESTEAEELGAFASLLSGVSSENEESDVASAKPPQEASEVAPESIPDSMANSLAPSVPSKEESNLNSDQEKSTMVCRHWKSKGFCRLESKCKFQHPEHKRGVTAPKSGNDSGSKCGDISEAESPGIRTTLSLTEALSNEGHMPQPDQAGQKKLKTSKNRSMTGQQNPEVVVPHIFLKHGTACVPCAPAVHFLF
jgi:hypothetical protein